MNGAHVALMGRVTRQAELRYTQNGNAMLRVGVLVNDSKRREDDPPEFADVTIWGEQAEQMAERLPIGTTVYIEGRARVRPWSAKDGTARASLDVSAWTAQPMGQIGRDAPRASRARTTSSSRDGCPRLWPWPAPATRVRRSASRATTWTKRRSEAGVTVDLVQRLIDAATEAIRNEAPALKHKPRDLRGLTLDLKINKFGQVVEGTAFVERVHQFKPAKDLVR